MKFNFQLVFPSVPLMLKTLSCVLLTEINGGLAPALSTESDQVGICVFQV